MLRQELLVLFYNKEVVCIKDKGQEPLCKTVEKPKRRYGNVNNNMPTYDPYIPRTNAIFYKCSTLECEPITMRSLTQLTPHKSLQSCFPYNGDYVCETIRYHNFKNVDKILFLSNNVDTKLFYTVDCLHYQDGKHVCQKKDGADSYTKLVDIGTIARPNARNVYSEDELICEEDQHGIVNCDLNLNVPYEDGVRLKKIKTADEILLRTDLYVVLLKPKCKGSWCGYSGRVLSTRRTSDRYEPPGSKKYRCYYAKKQQVCKEIEKEDDSNFAETVINT